MRRIWSNAFTIAIFLVAGLGLGYVVAKQQFFGSGPLAEDRVVEVPRGASMAEIAEALARDGVIDNAVLFKLSARLLGVASDLKAGEYEIAAGASMSDVLDLMTEGKALEHRVTVAEGLTVREVVALVETHVALVGEVSEIPPEGSLAPETYFVRRGETRDAVLKRMALSQERILAELWKSRAEGLPIATPEEALVLASIIEKETGVPSERPEVASVFVNRLRKGMKLQSDPTVTYGITKGEAPLGRELSRADLRQPTDYNTYTIDALPPGPIANPGRAAIEAALNPAETEYLYFVAEGAGGHVFAKTLAEHNQNVARWRALRRAQQQESGG